MAYTLNDDDDDDEYKLRSSLLCISVQPPALSSLLGLNILLSTPVLKHPHYINKMMGTEMVRGTSVISKQLARLMSVAVKAFVSHT
jgi:hypothetical protein